MELYLDWAERIVASRGAFTVFVLLLFFCTITILLRDNYKYRVEVKRKLEEYETKDKQRSKEIFQLTFILLKAIATAKAVSGGRRTRDNEIIGALELEVAQFLNKGLTPTPSEGDKQ